MAHPRAADGTLDAVNEQRQTPLHLAAAAASSQAVQLLLRHGAAVDARDARGRAALDLACAASAEACVNMLLAAGAAPNATDSEGATPLHRCAEVGATACARALLAAGATLERDKRGDSPLHVAAVRGHVDCMKCLVLASKSHGADTPRAADIRQSLADAPPTPSIGLDPLRLRGRDALLVQPQDGRVAVARAGHGAATGGRVRLRRAGFFARPRRGASAARRTGLLAGPSRPSTRPRALRDATAAGLLARRRGRRDAAAGLLARRGRRARRRPLPLDPRSPPDDDSDGDGDDAPPPWEDPRSPMRAKRDYVGGLGPPAVPPTPRNSRTSLAEDAVPPTPHNSRTSLAEDFEVQLPEPPVEEKQPESDAESDGMRAAAPPRHLGAVPHERRDAQVLGAAPRPRGR